MESTNTSSILFWLLGIVGAFFIGRFLIKIINLPKLLIEKWHAKQTDNYNKTLSSDEFLLWHYKLLEKYYGREYFTNILNEWYPVYIYRGIDYTYPFDNLCDKTELIFNKSINYKKNKYYKKYKQLVSSKIQRPEMQGFMLNELLFNKDKKVYRFKAWVGTYVENVYTSHILEYENYVLFKKYRKREIENSFIDIKSRMTIRNKIHENKSICEVLSSGCNRASLIIIQLIVMVKYWEDQQYKILIIKRSNDVAERQGFFQFVPTGGFEIYGDEGKCLKHDLEEQFLVRDTIFREYAEEVCGVEEFEWGKDGNTINNIRNHKVVKEIKDMIRRGDAFFEFLGSAVGLVSLKNELSFVLRIDDVNYSKNNFGLIKPNFESKKINIYSISEIEERIDKKRFNPPSAALYSLLINNHLYKEILQNPT